MLIDTDREWQAPVIGPHHLLKEAFDGGNIALRYSRMNSIVFLLSRARVLAFPLLSDFNVRLVYRVGSARQLQMWADSLIDLWGVSLDESGRSSYGLP